MHAMPTRDDIRIAEQKMNAAQQALLAYIDSQEHNTTLHQRLTEDLRRAIEEFMKLVG
jgi:protein tyrosine phosphatase (PTP) superfamily phosphohydrolase (DUF442 family)